jgi:hypothetical protein
MKLLYRGVQLLSERHTVELIHYRLVEALADPARPGALRSRPRVIDGFVDVGKLLQSRNEQ